MGKEESLVHRFTGIALHLTLMLEGGGWLAPRPGRFTPGKDMVPIVQEAGWVPELVWVCAKNLVPTGTGYEYLRLCILGAGAHYLQADNQE
jgi:hypothetical protein